MKNKWFLISSIVQVIIGLLGIASFIILLINYKNITKWIVTLILAIVLLITGIVGIINYKNLK